MSEKTFDRSTGTINMSKITTFDNFDKNEGRTMELIRGNYNGLNYGGIQNIMPFLRSNLDKPNILRNFNIRVIYTDRSMDFYYFAETDGIDVKFKNDNERILTFQATTPIDVKAHQDHLEQLKEKNSKADKNGIKPKGEKRFVVVYDSEVKILNSRDMKRYLQKIKSVDQMCRVQIVDTDILVKYYFDMDEGCFANEGGFNFLDRSLTDHIKCKFGILIAKIKDLDKPFKFDFEYINEKTLYNEEDELKLMEKYRRGLLHKKGCANCNCNCKNEFMNLNVSNIIVAKLYIVKNGSIIGELKWNRRKENGILFHRGQIIHPITVNDFFDIAKSIDHHEDIVDKIKEKPEDEVYSIFEDHDSETMTSLFEQFYFDHEMSSFQMVDVMMKHCELDAILEASRH